MTDWAYMAIAFGFGSGAPVQTSMVSAMGQRLNPQAAAWISANGTWAGVAIVLLLGAAGGGGSGLPSPFDRAAIIAAASALAFLLLVTTARSLPWYYAATGLIATVGLVGIAFLVPRIGVAPVFAAFTLGQVSSTLIVDQVGVFGAEQRRVTTERVTGVAFVAAGTLMVRLAA